MAKRTTRMYLDKIEADKDVLTLARERVATIFDRFDHVCVSFSGGKDSTVCLNLCLEEHRRRHGEPLYVIDGYEKKYVDVADSNGKKWDGAKLHVLFYDEEAIPYQTEEYVRRVAELPDVEMSWICLPIKLRNGCSPAHPVWWSWDPEQYDKWVRPMPPEGIITPEQLVVMEENEWPDERVNMEFPVWPSETRPATDDVTGLFFDPKVHGIVAFVMGIRGDESMTRLRAVTRKKEENWIVQHAGTFSKGNVFKCYPIYDWKTTDVWTAPAKLGWDYNRAYDVQELIGIHGSSQRIAPPFGDEPMQMLHMYAKGFPEVWDRMVDRVPGAAAGARYSRTELYGYGGRPKPKRDESWEDLVKRLLAKHEPTVRQEVAARLRQEINWHYGKIRELGWPTKDHPILPTAPHPITGMSWEWIAMVALRGDTKRRKTAGWELGEDSPEKREKLWATYRAQKAETDFARGTVS